MKQSKLLLIAIIAAVIGAFFYFDLASFLSFENLKSSQGEFQAFYAENSALTLGLYFALYVVVAALSLPGAAIMTLAGGALFGFGIGIVVVSFASTIGATFAFLAARFVLRDAIQAKYGDKLKAINDGVEKDGAFYLFTMRLIPAFPFFIVNLVMGLTPLKTVKYFFVSQLGMLPGTAVFVNAGTQLAQIDSLAGILSPGLLGSFALLGVFPIVVKKIMEKLTKNKGEDVNIKAAS